MMRWSLVAWCVAASAAIVAPLAQAQLTREQIVADVSQSAPLLSAAIRDAVGKVGGDVEREHVHLALGFSTGHFAQDPLAAEALRAVAGSLVGSFLLKGDQLSVYAWEMDLWSPPGIGQNPVTVPGDAGPEKAKLHDLFPLTPQAGSVGGHDTERAIVEMTQRLKDDHRAVLVLLTNTAASINSPGARVIGANDPRYRSALQSWRRVAQVNESGASLVLPVTMTRPGDRPVTRIIDAVILVPASFVGSPISSGTRSQRAGRSETPLRPIPSRAELRQPLQFDLRWLLLPGIGVLVAVVIWLIQPRGGLLLEVEGSTFDLATIRDGDEICHLAGPGYPSPNPRTISITSPGAPPERIARFFKERGAAVLVRGDRLKLRSVDGAVVDNCKRLGDEGLHTLVFRGEVHHHPALPSQMVQIQVRTHLKRAPHPGKEA